MFVLVLNASNVVNDGTNSTYIYNFPNSVSLNDKYIAVSTVTLYYSWFNIDTKYNNVSFTYTWTLGGVSTPYTINIPNGLYNITDINAYCQWVMIQNLHYLIDNNGSNVYYFELLVNPNRYAIQLNTFLFPTSLPPGWTQPVGFAGYPTQRFNPIITFPANFNKIVGYRANFISNGNVNNAYTPPTPSNASNNFVAKDGAGTLSYLSDTFPDVQPNSSIFLSISNINNPYSQPSSIIYSITPTVAIGEQVIERPPNFMWNKMINGTYNQLRVQFLGIDKQPISLKDPNLTIILTVRDKDEGFLGTK
jgi:hypothetical protein